VRLMIREHEPRRVHSFLKIVSVLGITWGICASFWLMFVLVTGWLTPSHVVVLALNDYGEMWYEVLLLPVFFAAWAWWIYKFGLEMVRW